MIKKSLSSGRKMLIFLILQDDIFIRDNYCYYYYPTFTNKQAKTAFSLSIKTRQYQIKSINLPDPAPRFITGTMRAPLICKTALNLPPPPTRTAFFPLRAPFPPIVP